jgi:hypothetical protein
MVRRGWWWGCVVFQIQVAAVVQVDQMDLRILLELQERVVHMAAVGQAAALLASRLRVAHEAQSVSYGPETLAHSHQLALDRLNFGVENESLH